MTLDLGSEAIGGAVLALLTVLVGVAQWARQAYLQRAVDIAETARRRAEEQAREEEQHAAKAHADALTVAAETRREAEKAIDAEAATTKATVTHMGDDEAINEAARLAAEKGWR